MQEDYDLIESYLRGELSDEQTADFWKRLTNEPRLQERFQDEQVLYRSLQLLEEKNKLRAFEDDYADRTDEQETQIVKVNWWRSPLAIAAVLALFIATGAILYLNQPSPAYEYSVPIYAIEGSAFAGDEKMGELTVQIHEGKGTERYRFKESLVLFLREKVDSDDIRLYRNDTGDWWLQVNVILYQLSRDGLEHPLE